MSPPVSLALAAIAMLGAASGSEALVRSAVNVHVDTSSEHAVSPLYLGCHSDSGYVHQPRGLHAQMVTGESFEQNIEGVCNPSCWTYFRDPSVQASVVVTDHPEFSQGTRHSVVAPNANLGGNAFHGQHSLSVSILNQAAVPDIPGG